MSASVQADLPRTSGVIVLASGAGSTLQALLEQGIEVRAVICDRTTQALAIAQDYDVKATKLEPASFANKEDYEHALEELIEQSGARFVVLAGYMRLLSAGLVRKYPKRMLNIHPSLLPKLKGLDTHRRALETGESVHGCSVHWVEPELDSGEVIARSEVPVWPDDDPVSLQERVKAAERKLYPKVIANLLATTSHADS